MAPGPADFCHPFDSTKLPNRTVMVVRQSYLRDTCLHPTEACAIESIVRAHSAQMKIFVYGNKKQSGNNCPTADFIVDRFSNRIEWIDDDNGSQDLSNAARCSQLMSQNDGGICLASTTLTLRPLHCISNLLKDILSSMVSPSSTKTL